MDNDMKKRIFLIGDSIRFGADNSIGYGKIIKEKLKDVAYIHQPDENCRFTIYTLRNIHEWAQPITETVDIVYWNNGLWDIARINGDEPLIDINDYGKYLVRIFHRLTQVFPKAKIFFAFTTPVIEKWQNENFFRKNSDIENYNKKAVEVLKPLGVEFDDLYSLAKSFGEENRADWVHFDNEGSEILASHIMKTLGY